MNPGRSSASALADFQNARHDAKRCREHHENFEWANHATALLKMAAGFRWALGLSTDLARS
jgi:hypothetical protein